MSEQNETARPPTTAAQRADPTFRAVSIADVNEAWSQGLRDFRAAPAYGLVFGGLYAAGGIAVVLGATALGLGYLAYPLAAAFALIGPFAAVGLYEVSRRQEAGLALSWRAVLSAIFSRRKRSTRLDGSDHRLVFRRLDRAGPRADCPVSRDALVSHARRFPRCLDDDLQWSLVSCSRRCRRGNFSISLFSLTFVSFPLLLDRDIDVVTAMLTSVRAVIASPVVAIGWAVIVVLLLIVACLPFFLGILVVLPVLGHTTWHLYRRIVVRSPA